MKTRIIGDIHGKTYDYKLLLENTTLPSIQVGDFGMGFMPIDEQVDIEEFQGKGNHRFIRGNHDNPSLCKSGITSYIPDGTIENDVMFIGGAWSIDHGYRVAGVDWWADEECSYSELRQFLETYSIMRPRVMITHDCPSEAAYRMFVRTGLSLGRKALYLTRTGEALQQMFEIHQPEEWYFGHWHISKEETINGTRFKCLGELDFEDVDL